MSLQENAKQGSIIHFLPETKRKGKLSCWQKVKLSDCAGTRSFFRSYSQTDIHVTTSRCAALDVKYYFIVFYKKTGIFCYQISVYQAENSPIPGFYEIGGYCLVTS